MLTGRVAIQSENRLIIKLAKSVSKCAASVAMARLLAKNPPTTSTSIKTRQRIDAIMSLLRALVSTSSPLLPVWQCDQVMDAWDLPVLSSLLQHLLWSLPWLQYVIGSKLLYDSFPLLSSVSLYFATTPIPVSLSESEIHDERTLTIWSSHRR